jgi:hypothetical protein
VWGIGYNRVLTYKNTIYNRESAKNPQRKVQTMTKENTKVNGNDSLVRPDGLNQQSHAASAFHSYWVTQIATTGLIGMSILVAFFLYLIKKTLSDLKKLFSELRKAYVLMYNGKSAMLSYRQLFASSMCNSMTTSIVL